MSLAVGCLWGWPQPLWGISVGAQGPVRKARSFCSTPLLGKGQAEDRPSKPGFLTNDCLASTDLRTPNEHNNSDAGHFGLI